MSIKLKIVDDRSTNDPEANTDICVLELAGDFRASRLAEKAMGKQRLLRGSTAASNAQHRFVLERKSGQVEDNKTDHANHEQHRRH